MADIREIPEGQTRQASEAILLLRPRWRTSEAVVSFVDTQLRPAGYRLTGVFEKGLISAVSVVGFRETWSAAWGHYLYVDDLSTVVRARGRGYADVLMQRVLTEAGRLDCEAVHLDSGVGSDRSAAHRLYMRNHFQITSHHFAIAIESG